MVVLFALLKLVKALQDWASTIDLNIPQGRPGRTVPASPTHLISFVLAVIGVLHTMGNITNTSFQLP